MPGTDTLSAHRTSKTLPAVRRRAAAEVALRLRALSRGLAPGSKEPVEVLMCSPTRICLGT